MNLLSPENTQTNKQTNKRTHPQMNEQANKQTNKQNKQTNKQTNGTTAKSHLPALKKTALEKKKTQNRCRIQTLVKIENGI